MSGSVEGFLLRTGKHWQKISDQLANSYSPGFFEDIVTKMNSVLFLVGFWVSKTYELCKFWSLLDDLVDVLCSEGSSV